MNITYSSQWDTALLATAVLHLQDGTTLEFEGVRPDSIGPSAESPGVIGVEFDDDYDRVVHVPFVRFWEIQYR